ncbi:MAG: Dehydrogenase (flavoprotein) [Verrucomicrobia bacterium]|nr:MAG: Dehydrogenase (flavoprotein) [Verrucomicrobiota bacterium]
MTPSPVGRRVFLQSVGGAFVASAFAPKSLYGAAESVAPTASAEGKAQITFLEPAEVLVCGSTLFACQLALEAAKRGKRTVLVLDRVNPFYEGIACLRPWVANGEEEKFPSVVRGVLNAATSETKGGRTYFNASKAALEIEDQLSEAGVRFLYNASVAGALGDEGRLAGVVFGGKTGLFALESDVVVDATLEATVARAAGVRATLIPGPRRFHYVADLAAPASERTAFYTASNGAKVSVEIHHYFACFDLVLDSTSEGPLAMAEDFDRVYAAVLEMPWNSGEKRFRGGDGFLTSGIDRLEVKNGRVEGFENLFVFGPKGMPSNDEGSLVLKDWRALFAAFPDAVERVVSVRQGAKQPRPTYEFWNRGVPRETASEAGVAHQFFDHGFDEPGTSLEAVRFHPPAVALKTEVLVTGGGTSGNAASYACASLGLKTVCLERGLELGGANTIGGVTNLWFGKRTKAFDEYYEAMEAKNNGLNAPGFYKGTRKAGARVLFGCAITGVAHSGRSVRSIYVITPFGLTAMQAPRYIDATGDGAVAAWAGCGYTFGGEHDELTLWASFAGYKPGRGEALRPFLSPCDERSPLDTTRFILSMRRNSKISLDQVHVPPPFYLAPRESRHIRGGKTLTFLDLLAGRRFKDGVFRVESNPDIKGLATSDAAKAGFIPTNWKALYQATVPYAAMIPVSLDNVIIAGKAYSVTHDALSAARMQRDLCVMGMVAGHAVRLAVDAGTLLRDIPVESLQKTLISKGMLKPLDLADDDFGFGLSPEEIAKKVASSNDMDACLPTSAMLCLLPRARALAALEPFAATPQPSVQRVLCFLGSPKGTDAYLQQVDQALRDTELSNELFGGVGTKHLMPDQGYAPVAALMLGSLCAVRDRRTVPLLAKLAERLALEPKDLRPGWGYFYSLACGFERLACLEGRRPLKQVLAAPFFADQIITRAEDMRGCQNTVGERVVYLQMALFRALTRCGDPEGALGLCLFLNEARVCLARAARAELVIATGQNFGFRAEAWREWIQKNAQALQVNPQTAKFA